MSLRCVTSRTLKNLIFLLAVLLFLPLASRADVIFKKISDKEASLKITGYISGDDVAPLKKVIETINKEHLKLLNDSVELDSKGGTVYGSMAVGRVIRSAHLSTLVKKDVICDSACVYVLVAGVCRMADGEVGVHQVFYEVSHSRKETEDIYGKEKALSLGYLDEMDAPRAIYELGNSTPSYNIRQFTESEKEDFGLYAAIASEQDYRMSVAAKKRNVSKRVLLKELDERFVKLNAKGNADKLEHPSCSDQLFLN